MEITQRERRSAWTVSTLESRAIVSVLSIEKDLGGVENELD